MCWRPCVALTLGVGYDVVDTPWPGLPGARLVSRNPVHIVRGRMWKPRPDTLPENVTLYHAGDKLEDGRLVTSGGRVLGVTAVAPTLKEALTDAYTAAAAVEFEGKYLRRDIGRRALDALED